MEICDHGGTIDLVAEPTLSASITRTLVATAERLGAEPGSLLSEAGLSTSLIRQPDGRVPIRKHMELFRKAIERTGRPDFALEVGRAFRPGTLNVVSHAAMHAPDLRAAWRTLTRYWRFVAEGTLLSLTEENEVAVMAFEMTDSSLPFAREGSEAVAAGQFFFARWLTQLDLRPNRVTFAFPEPPHAEAHRRLFEGQVDFSSERTELHWPRSVLNLPTVAADPKLEHLFQDRIRESLDALTTETDPEVVSQVRTVVITQLRGGDVSLSQVAQELAVSRRSLQRRLSDAGTSFQTILDDCRRSLCVHHLSRRDLSVEEVAFLAGFSEPSSFFRAFRRWTGCTPGEWRARLGQTADALDTATVSGGRTGSRESGPRNQRPKPGRGLPN